MVGCLRGTAVGESENSLGFHADQESGRVLAEAIDYARQGEVKALGVRTPPAPAPGQPAGAVEGVTPAGSEPPGPHRRQ